MSKEHLPLVSICMPAYNVGSVIGEALASVLSQTYVNIEVIVVDDGSKDSTADVARSIQDPRFRYVKNETNLGGFQTMNRAIGLSTGEFVAVYHTDDVYEPTIVEKELAYLQSHPEAGAVFCLDHFIDYEGRVYGGLTMPSEFVGRDMLRYEDVFPFILRRKNALIRCPTFMTRRAVLNEVGLFDAKTYDIVADLEMWLRIVRRYPIGILNERLMRYRHGQAQWSSRYNYLRTEPDLFFSAIDDYLQKDGWVNKLTSTDLTEYAFHRCDDETFRAANWVIRGSPAEAKKLLVKPYPWKTLSVKIRRRKLRVLCVRMLMQLGLALHALPFLSKLLLRTEYKKYSLQ